MMQYRVCFKMSGWYFYTEWFETLHEANFFVREADDFTGLDVRYIENSDGEVI